MPIRVLLADDQALLRSTFRLLLDSVPDIEVVGEAADGVGAVKLARQHRPDVILMDIRMPNMDGIEATRRILADSPSSPRRANSRQTDSTGADKPLTRILVLTTFETDDLILAALRAGASGFLGKGIEPGELIAAIRTIYDGDQLLSPAATRAVIERALAHPEPRKFPGFDELTDREREIMGLVGAGLSNNEIAEKLFISPATAKTHVNRAMAKTNARDRAQLVVLAYESGLTH